MIGVCAHAEMEKAKSTYRVRIGKAVPVALCAAVLHAFGGLLFARIVDELAKLGVGNIRAALLGLVEQALVARRLGGVARLAASNTLADLVDLALVQDLADLRVRQVHLAAERAFQGRKDRRVLLAFATRLGGVETGLQGI